MTKKYPSLPRAPAPIVKRRDHPPIHSLITTLVGTVQHTLGSQTVVLLERGAMMRLRGHHLPNGDRVLIHIYSYPKEPTP